MSEFTDNTSMPGQPGIFSHSAHNFENLNSGACSKVTRKKYPSVTDSQIINKILFILPPALLLVALGVYVYLGSKAEGLLLKNNGNTRKRYEKGRR